MAEESEKSLDEMTVAELRQRASALEITGRSSMNKAELRQAVEDAEEQTAMLKADSSGGHSESTKAESSDSESTRAESSDSESSDADERPWRESSSSGSGSDDEENDAEGITAPSIGPNTKIEHRPPEERLDLEKISDVDAMGLDKRRQVGGKRYGASPAKQAVVYGGALAVIAALVIGGKLLADELDKPPEVQETKAPWADNNLKPPAPIDFPKAPPDESDTQETGSSSSQSGSSSGQSGS